MPVTNAKSGGGGGGAPGGLNTQIQFNDGGAFAGSSFLTYNKTTGQLKAAQVATGDFVFDNGWILTEGDKIGLTKESIHLVRPDKSIAASW